MILNKKKLAWLQLRLSVISFPEFFFRLKQFFQIEIIDRLHSKNPPSKNLDIHEDIIKHYANIKTNLIKDQKRNLKNYQYSFFNQTIDDVRKIDKWRKDYKTGKTGPLTLHSNFDKTDFNKNGDIKYITELSRFHHLPLMILQNYTDSSKSGNEYLNEIIAQWTDQNPYAMGPNWSSGIDVSIRAVNWVFALLINYTCSNEINRLIKDSLYPHYLYLKSHLSKYSSANNHYVAELSGIIILSCFFKGKKFDRDRNKYLKKLLTHMDNIIHDDGFSMEQSTRYHATTLEWYIASFAFLKMRGIKASTQFLDKMLSMIKILKKLQVGKYFVTIGDDDNSSLVFPYNDSKFCFYMSILNSAAIIFNDPEYLDPSYYYDFRNILLHGTDGEKTYTKLINSKKIKEKNSGSIFFKESGYFMIQEKNNYLILDAGPLGLPPLGAHGHSDALSIQYYYDKIPFIVDTNTYQYHSQYEKWRQYFKSTKSHNTISIDGLNQAEYADSMIWRNFPEISIIESSIKSDHVFCTAEHNGFIQQGKNVRHRRKVEYIKSDDTIYVHDFIFCNGNHSLTYYLHFHPELDLVQLKNNRVILKKKNVTVEIENEFFPSARIQSGNKKDIFGWYSNTYGQLTECNSLMLNLDIHNDFNMITKIKHNRKK